MFPAAQVIFLNRQNGRLLDWLLLHLAEHVRFKLSRTEWRGFTTTIPQIRVATGPVELTIQLDEDPRYVAAEIKEFADRVRGRIDPAVLAALLQCRSRLDIMSVDVPKPRVGEKPKTVTVEATTNLDPKDTDVEAVLTTLSDLTGGFLLDLVNDRFRLPGQQEWTSH